MPWPCVNLGGADSLVRLEMPPVFEKDMALPPESVRALTFWRARAGQVVTLAGPDNRYYRGRVTAIGTDTARVVPFAELPRAVESPLRLTVFQALPEKERFELILQKLTELGVQRIVPFHSQRSTTLRERDAGQRKSHRWPEVLLRAAKQCRRATIPELAPVADWSQALQEMQAARMAILLYEGLAQRGLGQVLRRPAPDSVALMVGPEGGFTEQELEAAQAVGAQAVSLGPRILRTETAAIVGTAAVQLICGDLNI